MKIITIILSLLVTISIFASNVETVKRSLTSKIIQTKKTGKMPIVIFDIDHTIINSSPRIKKILKDANKKYYSKALAKYLKDDKNSSFRYKQIKELLISLKVKPKKIEKILKYVDSKFFLSDYTKYDVALVESLKLVNEFYKKGAFIIYLTARGRSSLVGTITSLDRLGFPIAKTRTSLIMRDLSKKSVKYKKDSIAELSTMGKIVAIFDDKIANLKQLTPFFKDQYSLYLVNSKTKNKKISSINLK